MHTQARSILLSLAIIVLLYGCATGEYGNDETGLTYTTLDLTVQEVKVAIEAPTSEETSASSADDKAPSHHILHAKIIGSDGWTVVQERASIGTSLILCDEDNNVIVDASDLLDDDFPYGVPKVQLNSFDVFFEMEEKLVEGETYNMDLVLFDKSGGGFISINMPIVGE